MTNPIPYLKTVDTPTLANAIEELNVRPRSEGFAPLDIRCLFPEMGRMVGYAVTAQVETVSRGTPLDKVGVLRSVRSRGCVTQAGGDRDAGNRRGAGVRDPLWRGDGDNLHPLRRHRRGERLRSA